MAHSTSDKMAKEGVVWNRYNWQGAKQPQTLPEFPKSSRIKEPRARKEKRDVKKISCPLVGCGIEGTTWEANKTGHMRHRQTDTHLNKYADWVESHGNKEPPEGSDLRELWAPLRGSFLVPLAEVMAAIGRSKIGRRRRLPPAPPPLPPPTVSTIFTGPKEKENAVAAISQATSAQVNVQPVAPRDPLVYQSPVRPGALSSPSKDPLAALFRDMKKAPSIPGLFKSAQTTQERQVPASINTKRARADNDELPTLKAKLRKTSSMQDHEDDSVPAFAELDDSEENLFGDNDLFGDGEDEPASFADLVASSIGTRASVVSDDEDALAVGTQDTGSSAVERVADKTIQTGAAHESDYLAKLFGSDEADEEEDGIAPQSDYLAAALSEGEDQDKQGEQEEQEQEAEPQSDFLAAAMFEGTGTELQGQGADNTDVFETGPYLTYGDACISDDEDGSKNGEDNSEADEDDLEYVDGYQDVESFDDASDSASDSSDDDE